MRRLLVLLSVELLSLANLFCGRSEFFLSPRAERETATFARQTKGDSATDAGRRARRHARRSMPSKPISAKASRSSVMRLIWSRNHGSTLVAAATRPPDPLHLADLRWSRDATTEPASVQERWFARLYIVKPLVIFVVAAFWIMTGLVSLGPGWDVGLSYMREGGLESVGAAGIIAGAVADIVIGIGIAIRRTARLALYAALALSAAYMIAGTFLLPRLWADPIGPMMKIWPIMVLILVAIAVVEDR